MALFGA